MGTRSLTINTVRPHDLVRLSDLDGLALDDAPTWVRDSISETPWVVARRASAMPGFIAVGVRGARRSLRHAMIVRNSHIDAIVRPEELVDRTPTRDMPVFRVLTQLRSEIGTSDPLWGPAGSAGFELASGAAAVTESSDLDLIVRLSSLSPNIVDRLAVIYQRFAAASVRIDCQIQLPAGAVALSEVVGASPQLLFRTEAGALLASRHELIS